ncbi:MAG TPA: DUF4256 domain-containing protein [Flavitalea sp.]|nr:DUF4256 domain-containing protein [Flavitalea sp.]
MSKQQQLSDTQRAELINTLKARFQKNIARHQDIDWSKVQSKLEGNNQKLWSLNEMEGSGGEPDVIGFDTKTNEFIFVDCSAESPKGRRSLCYDREALDSRKENKPGGSAVETAAGMGIQILGEDEYRALQELGKFDMKTSSWVRTPVGIRKLGGAIFMDRRYDHIFLYHNGAESYYAARGFRGMLRV